MRPELLVDAMVRALVEQVEVLVAQDCHGRGADGPAAKRQGVGVGSALTAVSGSSEAARYASSTTGGVSMCTSGGAQRPHSRVNPKDSAWVACSLPGMKRASPPSLAVPSALCADDCSW